MYSISDAHAKEPRKVLDTFNLADIIGTIYLSFSDRITGL